MTLTTATSPTPPAKQVAALDDTASRVPCPHWPTCDHIADDNVALAHHLLAAPDSPEHTGGLPLPTAQPRTPDPTWSTRVIGAGALIDPDMIELGITVHRHSVPAGKGHVRSEIPCCAHDLFTGAAARGVVLPTDPSSTIRYAPCQQHRMLWEFHLTDEGEGYFDVRFVLVEHTAVVALTRSYSRAI